MQVSNLSASSDLLTLTSLVDDIHGDLNGQGSCAAPLSIIAGSSYECNFSMAMTGSAGSSETHSVTAAAQDDEDNPVDDSARATVTITDTDYGDVPDPWYPTLLASGGARHILGSGLFLGSGIDSEADGQPSASAAGDDSDGNDDEGGLSFSLIVPGTSAMVDVTASAPGMLNAWVDWNQDGDWSDLGEQILMDEPLVAGLNGDLVLLRTACRGIRQHVRSLSRLAGLGPCVGGTCIRW